MFIFISLLSHVALLISLYTSVVPKNSVLDSNGHQIFCHSMCSCTERELKKHLGSGNSDMRVHTPPPNTKGAFTLGPIPEELNILLVMYWSSQFPQ